MDMSVKEFLTHCIIKSTIRAPTMAEFWTPRLPIVHMTLCQSCHWCFKMLRQRMKKLLRAHIPQSQKD